MFGSGAGVVALRRLTDALDDGDVIHAVIRGSAVNNDGSSKVNYLAPSVDGQAACMVEAYGVAASIHEPSSTWSATAPAPTSAIRSRWRRSPRPSAPRPTSAASAASARSRPTSATSTPPPAVASLIKATLALEHAEIPPTLNFERPNPTIDFDTSPFRVADRRTPWPAPKGHPRRAAVNSLGVGGTNAHVVLQEPPARSPSDAASRPVQLLTLSAKSTASLDGAQAAAGGPPARPSRAAGSPTSPGR